MRNSSIEAARVIAFVFIYIENIPSSGAPKWAELMLATNIFMMTGKVAVDFFLVTFGYFLCIRLAGEIDGNRWSIERKSLFRLWWPCTLVVLISIPFIADVPLLEMVSMTYNITSSKQGYKDAFMPLWTIVMCFQCAIVWMVAFRFTKYQSKLMVVAFVWIALAIAVGIYLDSDKLALLEYNYKSPITHGAAVSLGVIIALRFRACKLNNTWLLYAFGMWLIALFQFLTILTSGGDGSYTMTQIFCTGVGGILFLFAREGTQEKRIATLAPYALAFYVVQAPVNWYFVVDQLTESWAINATSAFIVTCILSVMLTKYAFQRP